MTDFMETGVTMGMSLGVLSKNTSSEVTVESPPARRFRVRPRWQQPRFIVGLGLVVAAVALATALMGSAQNRISVWSASSDLSPGTVIQASDIVVTSALPEMGSHYLAADDTLVGSTLTRPILAGEIIPAGAVSSNHTDRRLVTLPVEPIHAPTDLARGQRVDVYVSPRDSVGAGASRLVVTGALIEQVASDVDRTTGELAVVLSLDPGQVSAVVSAGRGGVIDLVSVPSGEM